MRTVEILPENYKPTKAESEEPVHINAAPLAVAGAVAQAVNVEYKSIQKHRAKLREQRRRVGEQAAKNTVLVLQRLR